MTTEAYRRWAASLSSLHVPTTQFLQSLPHISIPQRKVLLHMTRVQHYPHPGTRIFERHRSTWFTQVEIRDPSGRTSIGWQSLKALVDQLSDIPLSPIFSGFLSSCIRSAPYLDYTSAEDAKVSAVYKEIEASTEITPSKRNSYRPIFANDVNRNAQVFDGLPGNKRVSEQLHYLFQSTKSKLQDTIIFPKVSRKTVGPDTKADVIETLRMVPYDARLDTQEITIQLIERIYHLTGIQIRGSVELRSAWKYNDLKPRVYFAQGGDVYPATKHIQPILNIILEFFPFVHPMNRFNPPEDALETDEILVIYDYSSFTSKLDEIRNFIGSMAEFYSGTEIIVIDAKDGPVSRDLGEIFAEYNRTANSYASCDITELMQMDDQTFIRHTCGMLGVPGNISSCTLLHGIYTCYITGSLRKSRCIGDDARLHWGGWHLQDLYVVVAKFGDIAKEKLEVWLAEHAYSHGNAWAYAKRPINRLPENRVTIGQLVIFPTLDTTLGLKDQYHRYIPTKETLPARASRFSSQWSRLVKTLWSQNISISDFERELLYRYQVDSCSRLELLKYGVRVTRIEGRIVLVPLILQRDEFGMDPDRLVLAKMSFSEKFEFPLYDPVRRRPAGYQGEVLRSASSSAMGYVEALGYTEKELVTEFYSREQVGDRFFLVLYNGQYANTYIWTLLYDLPRWIVPIFPDDSISV